MTEDLAWLVALLSPRDIAIHPNFANEEKKNAPAILALLTSLQTARFSWVLQDHDQWTSVEEADPEGAGVIRSVQSAFSFDNVREGADELRLAARRLMPNRPVLSVVCTVIAANAYAETDQIDLAVSQLHDALGSLGEPSDSTTALLAGTLLANLSLRELDQGTEQAPLRASESKAALMSVNLQDLPRFPLSKGVAWDSTTSLRDIIDLLVHGCDLHLASHASDFATRLDLVRQPSPRHAQNMRGRIATSFQKYLEEELRGLHRLEEIRWSSEGTDGDSELSEALFVAEVSGHPHAHAYRRLLGMHRFLRGTSTGEEWLIQESLRLLRQSGDMKQLSPVLLAIRSKGPLNALRADALQVLAHRRRPALLRDLEMNVLGSAAQLLGEGSSWDAVQVMLASRNYRPPQTARHWQRRSARLGTLWGNAVTLSKAAGAPEIVARELFAAISEAAPDDEMDQEYARAVSRLAVEEWQDVGLLVQIGSWLAQETARTSRRECRAALVRLLDVAAPKLAPPVDLTQGFGLPEVQRLIDRSIAHKEISFPNHMVQPSAALLIDGMASTRKTAARGQYSWGGVSESELAVAMALLTQHSALWPNIADFLCDPRVQRNDKRGALVRLVRASADVPATFTQSLSTRVASLLEGGPELMNERPTDPFPEGLRLAAILGLLPSAEVLDQVGRLLGNRAAGVRRHGAEVLLDLLAAGFSYPWLSTSAMLLTQDRDTEVRAIAGRALTQLSNYGEVGEGAVVTRVTSLLEEDGYLVPNSVLVGLLDRGGPLSNKLRRKVAAIASTHIDGSARLHADRLLRSSS